MSHKDEVKTIFARSRWYYDGPIPSGGDGTFSKNEIPLSKDYPALDYTIHRNLHRTRFAGSFGIMYGKFPLKGWSRSVLISDIFAMPVTPLNVPAYFFALLNEFKQVSEGTVVLVLTKEDYKKLVHFIKDGKDQGNMKVLQEVFQDVFRYLKQSGKIKDAGEPARNGRDHRVSSLHVSKWSKTDEGARAVV